MDKRKYMKPTCEAVKVNTSQSLLTLVSLSSLSTTTYDATPGGSLVGKKRNDTDMKSIPGAGVVLWDQEVNESEDAVPRH